MADFRQDLVYMLEKYPCNNIKFRLRLKDDDLDIPIEELDTLLTQRAFNRLKNFHLDTIGKVIDKWNVLGNFDKVGKTSVVDIKTAVISYFYNKYTEEQIKDFWLRSLGYGAV